jgi:hypothetical protein
MSQADQTMTYRGYWISVFIEELAKGFESSYRFYVGESAPRSAAPLDSRRCGVFPEREAAVEKAFGMAKERIDVLCGKPDPREPKNGTQ